jgi:hypothetical protein
MASTVTDHPVLQHIIIVIIVSKGLSSSSDRYATHHWKRSDDRYIKTTEKTAE